VREAVPDTPIILGSGITLNAIDRVALADGSVFGYGAKPSGNMNDPVDGPTVKAFMEMVKKL
jgi:predicted TIM-barrel enzyme